MPLPRRLTRRSQALQYFVAGHPDPNEGSWRAAAAILALLRETNNESVVFFLLSGGGSALTELPLIPGMTLAELQAVNHALVTCGAPIEAMNTVRRHFSAVKGGRLAAQWRKRRRKLLSRLPTYPLGSENALASGPTVPDPSTIADVHRILDEYELRKSFRQLWCAGLTKGKCRKRRSPAIPPFATRIFSCCSACTICSMRLTMPPRRTGI